jgi:predicted DNA binding CopG/RHH family protein
MKKKLKPIPKFKSEAEERAFWEDESNDTTEYFDFSKAKRVTFPNLQPSTKTISLRLPQNLLDRIRVQANRLDVPYQSLMKVWLAEKLETVSREAR